MKYSNGRVMWNQVQSSKAMVESRHQVDLQGFGEGRGVECGGVGEEYL